MTIYQAGAAAMRESVATSLNKQLWDNASWNSAWIVNHVRALPLPADPTSGEGVDVKQMARRLSRVGCGCSDEVTINCPFEGGCSREDAIATVLRARDAEISKLEESLVRQRAELDLLEHERDEARRHLGRLLRRATKVLKLYVRTRKTIEYDPARVAVAEIEATMAEQPRVEGGA